MATEVSRPYPVWFLLGILASEIQGAHDSYSSWPADSPWHGRTTAEIDVLRQTPAVVTVRRAMGDVERRCRLVCAEWEGGLLRSTDVIIDGSCTLQHLHIQTKSIMTAFNKLCPEVNLTPPGKLLISLSTNYYQIWTFNIPFQMDRHISQYHANNILCWLHILRRAFPLFICTVFESHCILL